MCRVSGVIAMLLALLWLCSVSYAYNTAMKDPTRPIFVDASSVETDVSYNDVGIVADGILIGQNGQGVVMIDGDALGVGDTVLGARIVAIGKDGVTLKDKNGKLMKARAPYADVKSLAEPRDKKGREKDE